MSRNKPTDADWRKKMRELREGNTPEEVLQDNRIPEDELLADDVPLEEQAIDKLTHAQEAYCINYVKTGNASAAYKAAYPTAKDWKPAHVYVEACSMLKIPKINRRITELKSKVYENYSVSLHEIVNGLAQAGQRALEQNKLRDASYAYSQLGKIFGLDKLNDKSEELVKALLYTPNNGRIKGSKEGDSGE